MSLAGWYHPCVKIVELSIPPGPAQRGRRFQIPIPHPQGRSNWDDAEEEEMVSLWLLDPNPNVVFGIMGTHKSQTK